MKALPLATVMLGFPGDLLLAEEPWVITSAEDWKKMQGSAQAITITDGAVVLDRAIKGEWTSTWHCGNTHLPRSR